MHHDADARGLGVLAERPVAEIRAARPEIPTLEEALDACAGMLVNVEIKNLPGDADYDPEDGAAAAVVELLARRDRRDDVLVSSFNLETVDRVRALDRPIPTGFLTLVGIDPLDAVDDRARRTGTAPSTPTCAPSQATPPARRRDRAHELGLAVNVWTVNDADEIRRLAAAGVDAIITDVPDVARRAFGS